MKANLKYVKEKFDLFNKMIFNGQLKPLPIRIGNARTSLGGVACMKRRSWTGKVENTNFRLTISAYRDLPEEELDDVIIHEMIHYYILSSQISDTSPHGKIFMSMMTDINRRFGRHITVSRRAAADDSYGVLHEEAPISGHSRQRLVCVAQLADGRTAVAIVPRTRVFILWKELPKLFKLTDVAWYSTCSQYFEKYPTSLKPKMYIADREELEKNLKGAVELQNDGHIISPADQGRKKRGRA